MRASRPVAAVAALVCASVVVPSTPSFATTQVVFSFTGAAQSWTVPAGVTSITVEMIGAGGGGGRAGTGSTAFGGGGGLVSGTLTVVPGDTLTLVVGQGGINDNVTNPRNNNYRFGGGGSGAGNPRWGTYAWGSGGGRSAIRSSNAIYGTLGDLLTAGAGGGGGWEPGSSNGAGGAGGGLIGEDGGRGWEPVGGRGGTQTAGGAAGGPGEPGTPGIQYAGGYAQTDGENSEAGGGGGGYWGGGGGGNNGAGGGGSSYLGRAAYFTGTTTSGSGRNPGRSSWPSECGTNPGLGADPGDSSLVGLGGHGCIVITYGGATRASVTRPLPPAPWLQAYGRPFWNSPCDDGWTPSWAEWPNGGAGGFTCERRLEYYNGAWTYFPFFSGY